KNFKQPVAEVAATPMFTGTVTTGYDSMYNFRGVDWIPNKGISTATFTPVWHITPNDTFSVPLWFCVALGQNSPFNGNNYTELDVSPSYVHTFGNLAVGCGYTLYNYFNYGFPQEGGGESSYKPGGTGLQHEVNINANYTVKTGAVSWVPSIAYFYELGQAAPNNYASINAGSSFLSPALTVSVPLYKDIVSFNPNTQYNISFGYNNKTDGSKLYGFNNFQMTAPVTWKVTSAISLTAYVAYTYQPDLMNTVSMTAMPYNRFYGGASVGY
ncbi:MAG: hypothetical protein WCI42_04300, partial [Verrucomicrobiota bacterium]